MRTALASLLVALLQQPAFASERSTGPVAQSPRAIEDQIAAALNRYRASLGLPPVPRSRSLDLVARTHVADLTLHHPERDVDPTGRPCNDHSWSAHGPWRAVCYTADHAQAAAMWSKPGEITHGAYGGSGFEIAFATSDLQFSPDAALAAWRRSAPHNAVILEQGVWSGAHWRALGVGVGDGHAVVWFGKDPDPASR